MAAKTFYHLNALASGSNHMNMQDGGSAPTAATTGTGWVVGTVAANNYSLMNSQTEKASTGFGTTAMPNAAPENVGGDCWRTPNPLTGTFANANWTINTSVIAVTRAGSTQDGNVRVRVWKSPNADGSSATELTSATLVGGTVTNLTTTAQSSNITWSPGGAITLNNEYLFFQYAWMISGVGGFSNCDVDFRIGSLSVVTTSDWVSKLTPTQVPADTNALNDAHTELMNHFLGVPGAENQLVLSDAVLTSVVSEAVPLTLPIADTLVISDSLTSRFNYLLTNTDTNTLSDSSVLLGSYLIDKSDTNAISDATDSLFNYFIPASSTNILSDDIVLQDDTLLSTSDILSITDTPELRFSLALSIEDTVSIGDSFEYTLATNELTVDQLDSLGISDDINLRSDESYFNEDSLSLSDSSVISLEEVALVVALSEDIAESLSLLDNFGIGYSYHIRKGEKIKITDTSGLPINQILKMRRERKWN
jgi:hypothetical protein